DEGAEFVDGLTGRGLDDLQRFLGLVGIPLEAATRGGGVDADSGDVVGDAVVELTGYAHAFELECLLRQTLLLFADLGIGRLQFGQQASLRERPVAEEPGAAEEDGVDEEGDSGGGRELDEGHLPQISELE